MRFSRLLMIPLMFFIIIAGYVILKNDWIYSSGYVAGAIVLLVLVFVFSPQIDYWWWKRFTPALPKPIVSLFEQFKHEFVSLSQPDRKVFEQRLFLYLNGKDFEFMDIDAEPEDVKALAAYYAVLLSFGKADFMLEPYDKVVFFKDRFGSPAQNSPHVSECNVEDGVLIFSIKQLALGFKNPAEAFDTAMYEYAGIMFKKYPELRIELENTAFETKGMWHTERLRLQLNCIEIDAAALTLLNYYSFPQDFISSFPVEAQKIKINFPLLATLSSK
jgi:hypothetical protein